MGVLAELRAVCGEAHARAAGAQDRVADRPASWVAAPGSTGEVSRALRVAAEHDLHVVIRGAGTKLHWGAPPASAELLLDLSRLTGVVEHAAGDQVVVVRAGTRLASLQRRLGGTGQRLALDEMVPGATVGGAVAAGTAGPLRLRHGGPRDLLLGATIVRPDGVVAHSGGKVVKNVAGYDLSRLMAGSYGTLAVLTEAAFKVQPRPAARAFVSRPVRSPVEVRELCGRLKDSQLNPSAIEADCPVAGGASGEDCDGGAGPGPARRRSAARDLLVVLLEGPPDGVAARAGLAGRILGGEVRVSDRPPRWWGRYPFGPDDVAIQVVTPVGQIFAPVYALRDATKGITARAFCSPATGVLYAGLPGDTPPDRAVGVVAAMRAVATLHDGYCVVLSAPPAIRSELDLWGPVEGMGLMRAVKREFDPDRRLAPGRFVGGI